MSIEADEPEPRFNYREYLEVPLRRPYHVLVPFVLVTLAAVALGYVLPKRYRTSTLILVESQKAPDSVMKPGQDGGRPRLMTIRQEILSRTRLERVIEELSPYPNLKGAPLTSIVETMRDAAEINVKGNDAFTIEFVHRDPRTAQAVSNRLASLFIEETARSREEQVEGAEEFIATQLNEARQRLEEKDRELRRYKEAHMGRLPEQMGANLATLQRLQMEQQAVSESLRAARERLQLLERGLWERTDSGGNQKGTRQASPPSELSELRKELAVLRRRYTEEHPEVQGILARIARLEKRLAETPPDDQAGTAPADDDALTVRVQVQRAQLEVANQEAKLAELEKRTGSFQQRVEEAPRAELELTTLNRDYQKLNENYLTLLNKKLEAQMAARLEKRWKGEQFRVLDPAYLPEQPFYPNKRFLLGIGLLIGLVAGVALSIVAEFLDTTVKGVRSLEELIGRYPVLATIPSVPSRPAALRGRNLAAGTASMESVHAASMEPGPVAEEFHMLCSKVRALDGERAFRCFGIVSAVGSEGKSTVAVGLASALAREGMRVILIEADLRRPTIENYLGLPPAPGLSELLGESDGSEDSLDSREDWNRDLIEPAGPAPSPAGSRRVIPGGFHLISAGLSLRHAKDRHYASCFGGDRMKSLLEQARRSFDLVLVDCPPLVPVSDAIVFQDMLDGFLMVVRERRTPSDIIKRSVGRLKPERIRGLILNDHHEVMTDYYNKYASAYYGAAK